MPVAGGGGGGPCDPGDAADRAPPRVLAALTAALERLVARNEWVAETERQKQGEGKRGAGGPLDAFRGVRAPSITVGRYLDRIYRYTGCSPSCFVVGFAYVDRLLHRHPSSLILSVNVHRLILTSVMVASKVLDDVHHNNAFYAKVGGVSNGELNRLELELLFLVDFRVTVSSRVFESYCLHLERELLCNGGGDAVAGQQRRRLDGVERPIPHHAVVEDGEAPAELEGGEPDVPQSCCSSSSPPPSV